MKKLQFFDMSDQKQPSTVALSCFRHFLSISIISEVPIDVPDILQFVLFSGKYYLKAKELMPDNLGNIFLNSCERFRFEEL